MLDENLISAAPVTAAFCAGMKFESIELLKTDPWSREDDDTSPARVHRLTVCYLLFNTSGALHWINKK